MIELPVQVTSDEVHPHPRHTGRPWLDLLLALSAIFISVVSLFVAFEHGRAERQLVAANSWPFLQAAASISNTTGARVWIVNQGIGPAKLELFQVLYQGRPVASVLDLLQRCCGLPADATAQSRQLPDGLGFYRLGQSVFRPGGQQAILDIPNQAGRVDYAQSLATTFTSVSFRACYCSVFDECWMTNLRDLHQKPVSQCPTSEPSFNDTVFPHQ